jgi:hypothetical protein
VNIAHVETMERNRVGVASRSLWVTSLAVLLCFSKLGNDGNAEKLLSSQLDGERDGLFVSKLDIANTN